MLDIQQRVKALCKKQGVTQKELASKMGISEVALSLSLKPDRQRREGSKLKDRPTYPRLETLEKIAQNLGVEVWQLLYSPTPDMQTGQGIICPHCGKEIKISVSCEEAE